MWPNAQLITPRDSAYQGSPTKRAAHIDALDRPAPTVTAVGHGLRNARGALVTLENPARWPIPP